MYVFIYIYVCTHVQIYIMKHITLQIYNIYTSGVIQFI